MFTGIITDVGEILELEKRGDLRARIKTNYDTYHSMTGDILILPIMFIPIKTRILFRFRSIMSHLSKYITCNNVLKSISHKKVIKLQCG